MVCFSTLSVFMHLGFPGVLVLAFIIELTELYVQMTSTK